jgi:uncharacterized protein YcbK (DUF882 family)
VIDRRLLLLIIAGWAAWPRVAHAVPRLPPPIRLHLVNPHTGETFDGPYRDDKGPIPQAMAELCEFLRDFHCGAKIEMDVGALDFLAAVLAAVGETKATILSAYRTPQTNAMLARTMFGVAENSQHMYGRALDFTLGAKLEDAMTAARAMRRGGVGWYPHSEFIHIDSGPVRNWTLDDSGLGNLLLFDGPDGVMPFRAANRPLTTAERLALHRELARAEFLARRHLR